MNKVTRYIIGALSIVVLVLFVWFFTEIVAYILIAAVLSMIGRPLVNRLLKIHIKSFRFPRWLASLLTLACMVFVIVLFFRIIIPLVGEQINEIRSIEVKTLSHNLKDPYAEFDNWVHSIPFQRTSEFSSKEFLSEKIVNLIQFDEISVMFNKIGGALGSVLIGIFAVLFITFFFMKEDRLFNKGILLMVPEKYEGKTQHALHKIRKLISRYFIGLLGQVTGIVILVTTGLTISGVEFSLALLIGIIAGFLNLIPYLGPWIGAAIGIVMVIAGNLGMDFYDEMLPMLIFVLLTFAVTQLIDVMFFQPTIFGNSVSAHPLEVFLVILIAGKLAGVIGMMLAIPSYTVLRVFAREFFNQYKLVRGITDKMKED
ncbi:MAG: AI-2E family transporter [Bacteroidota bacterium]|nr:AI-2E family transporter [Bacteroidota bacterium]